MKVVYRCSVCGAYIDQVIVAALDEAAFGFDCLSQNEREEMLSFDPALNRLTVRSLCDQCIKEMDLSSWKPAADVRVLH